MRIALMGGTFDPPHLGHVVPVEVAACQFQLDVVWFIPNFTPPHKAGEEIVDAFHRAAMVAIALQPYPKFKLWTWELQKGSVSFTVETLENFRSNHLGSDDSLYFILGGDSFLELDSWYNYPRLLQLSELIIINRGNNERELSEGLAKLETLTKSKLQDRVHFCPTPYLPISSTEIRDAMAAGRSVSALVAPDVEAYIQKHGIYKRR
jgi:nicotinate-nucleotide adenylyltransferase